MSINLKRRVLLKGSLAASTLGVAAGAGLLAPQAVLAAWNTDAFKAKTEADAMTAMFGATEAEASGAIDVSAPEIAENGAVVPIKVETSLKAESISIVAPNNPSPMVSSFALGEGAQSFASTRIKMGKTGDVIAVVKADGKLYSARKSVKVTIGGCGG
ncbi:MAG: thiosulfate oxidation carrier protein SoxY [Gammaproteobacteria bacterium]|nr:thiosulfate oxidation carrier protein SoxY [Gammaproteobacteria bacterium]